jgi:hypothetical protein
VSLGSESNRVKQPYEGGLSIVPTSVSTSFTAAESPGGQYWKAKPGNARLQSSRKSLAIAKLLFNEYRRSDTEWINEYRRKRHRMDQRIHR